MAEQPSCPKNRPTDSRDAVHVWASAKSISRSDITTTNIGQLAGNTHEAKHATGHTDTRHEHGAHSESHRNFPAGDTLLQWRQHAAKSSTGAAWDCLPKSKMFLHLKTKPEIQPENNLVPLHVEVSGGKIFWPTHATNARLRSTAAVPGTETFAAAVCTFWSLKLCKWLYLSVSLFLSCTSSAFSILSVWVTA